MESVITMLEGCMKALPSWSRCRRNVSCHILAYLIEHSYSFLSSEGIFQFRIHNDEKLRSSFTNFGYQYFERSDWTDDPLLYLQVFYQCPVHIHSHDFIGPPEFYFRNKLLA